MKHALLKNAYKMAGVALAGLAIYASAPEAMACTRITVPGEDDIMVVARSLDWKTPIPTNLYVYPAGMTKQGSDQPGAITWTSKYGAVYAVGYDGGVTEGMNEKGLVINGLFCKGTVYDNAVTATRPHMTLAMFVAWLLDMNSTTDEVTAILKKHDFSLTGAKFDQGTESTLHWGITDARGKSAIVEFRDGEVNVYDMGDFRAMTNDPVWPDMTAIMRYWEKVGGTHMMPGTVSSPDRCVRANYFAHHVEAVADPIMQMSIARSAIMPSCVPYTYNIDGEPNVSSTQWRSYAELRDCLYGFEIVTNPGWYYIDLKKCNLKPGAPVLKLDTSTTSDLAGCANKRLKKSAPFTPMY